MGKNDWPGFFLVLDGIDGCGKSTQAKKLSDYFKTNDIQTLLTAEPSDYDLGKILRKYLQNSKVPASVDALLFAADRIEHCDKEILPLLKKGFIVISDRYRDSSYIYQSIEGRNEGVSMDWIKKINKFSLIPDLTIIIDIDPKIGLKRKKKQASNSNNQSLDKFEIDEFQNLIREEFIKIAKNSVVSKEGVHVLIDGNESEEEVFKNILLVIKSYIKSDFKVN
ncbi:MAG: dTMP kinase [Promethearchaeota archaeon]